MLVVSHAFLRNHPNGGQAGSKKLVCRVSMFEMEN